MTFNRTTFWKDWFELVFRRYSIDDDGRVIIRRMTGKQISRSRTQRKAIWETKHRIRR